MSLGSGLRVAAALLWLLAAGCSRDPDRGAPAGPSAAPPGPPAPSASAPPAPPDKGPPSPDAGGAAEDADPIPEAERKAIAGQIAFISERDDNPEVYLVRPSGEGLRRVTSTPMAEYTAAAAPDGSALLIIAVEEEPKNKLHLEQLVVQPLDGGPGKPIGPRGGRNRNPSWSPDGRWVVFESDAESFSDIYRVGRDGSGLLRLTRNIEGNFEPALSPDGANIAFVSSRDGDPELYRTRADGTGQRRLTAFHREDWSPRWSPDGKRLAFLSDREGRPRIFVMNADGTHLSALTPSAPEVNAPAPPPVPPPPPTDDAGAPPAPPQQPEELEPVWSPDGTRIAYVTRGAGTKARIWVADVATRTCKPLTDGASSDEAPVWSPDGRYLAFSSSRTGDPEIYLMRADGTGQTRLTRAKGADWLPRWIPAAKQAR